MNPAPPEPSPTVYVIGDDPAIRASLARLLEEVGTACVPYDNAIDFLRDFDADAPGPVCLVLDVRIPIMSGTDFHKALIGRGIGVPVILISGHGDIPMAVEALQRGAFDFIEKPFRSQHLLERVQQALDSDRRRRHLDAEHHSRQQRFDRLTPREREVLDRVVQGMTNRQIAEEFGVSSQAIDAHRTRVIAKLGVENVAQLIQIVLYHRGQSGPPAST